MYRLLLILSCLAGVTGASAKVRSARFQLHGMPSDLRAAGYNQLIVIDRRADTGDYGTFRSGPLTYRLQSAVPLQAAVEALDSQTFGSVQRSAGALYLLLRECRIGQEQGVLGLNFRCDLFIQKPGEAGCRFIIALESFYESPVRPGAADSLLNKAWRHCLYKGATLALDPGERQGAIALQDLPAYADSLRDVQPAYRDERYPRGVYPTHEAFLKLEPAPGALRIVHSNDKPGYPFTIFLADSAVRGGWRQLASTEFYAACDGKRWYKTSLGTVGLMWKEGRAFYCRGFAIGLPGTPGVGQAVALGAFSAAMTGSATIAVAQQRPDNPLPVKTAYRFRLALDGRLIPVGRY